MAASAAQKAAIIQDKIVTTEYATNPDWPDICVVNELSAGRDLNNMFDRFSDERPADFPRFFHFNGIIASVQYVPTPGLPFTGLFRGADYGVLRFSPLAPTMSERYLRNYIHGTILFSFGLKFFRSGIHSGNLLAGDTAKGRNAYFDARSIWTPPEFNIFSRPLDNMPGIPGDIGERFEEFERFSGVLSTSDFASYQQDGAEEDVTVAPLLVHFRPNPALAEKFGRIRDPDFRKYTTGPDDVPPGTLLYSVWTTVDAVTGDAALCVNERGFPIADDDVPIHCTDQIPVQIGEIVSTSKFFASEYSDRKIMFQHTRVCPKDQSVCTVVNPAEQPELTIPRTSFGADDNEICVSDLDKDGQVDGIAPGCPVQASQVSNYCFPGIQRGVETTQTAQCPFMQIVDPAILNAITDIPESNCGFFGRAFEDWLLQPFFDVFIFFMRTVTGMLSFIL